MNIIKPEIKKGRKYDQVLAGARDVFLRDGFEGASVDEIARKAGVSKATLYSYFADKRLLFIEVAKEECRRQADAAMEVVDGNMPPAVVLKEAGRRIIAFITSEIGQRVFRICVAESDRFPNLGHDFYQSGPMMIRERLSHYLQKAVDKGELVIDDIELAADQFAELCKADIHAKMIFGVKDCCTTRDISRTIDSAVEMFMARYGVPTAKPPGTE